MKARLKSRLGFVRNVLSSVWLALAVAVLGTAEARAASVNYSPFSQNLEGNTPFTQAVTFKITAPSNLISPANITFDIVPTSIPTVNGAPIVDVETAKRYVTVTPSPLTFSHGGDFKPVTVTLSVPKFPNVPPGTVLLFSYNIFTVGWGVAVTDRGMSLNAKVTAPAPKNDAPPAVTITTPGDGTVFTYMVDQLPATIPMQFVADTTAPMSITAIDATLDGNELILSNVSGIGSLRATGTAQMTVSAPGEYKIVAHGSNAIGVAETSSTFKVVVNGPPPTVTINTPAPNTVYEHVYGAPPVNVPFTFTADAPAGTTIRTLEAKLDGVAITVTTAGMFTRQATGSANLDLIASGQHTLWVRTTNEYGEATTQQTFTINRRKAPLTVTADRKTKIYGEANPALTYTIAGFVNGETLSTSDVTGTTALSTTAVTGSQVGSYPIVPTLGSLASNNYQFVFVDGPLEVTKAVLTLAAQPAAKRYGDPLPQLGYTISGFVNGDTAAVVSGSPVLATPATITSVPGVYAINVLAGSLAADNYTFKLVANTLAVTKANLTFTALDASRVYGAATPNFGYNVSGFVNSDTALTAYAGNPALSSTATASSSVAGSPYPIAISTGTLTSEKYNFVFVPAKLSVTRAPLVVKADDKTKTQGAANPALTYSVSGFVNGETAAVLSGAPALSTTATQNSPVGAYPINVSGGSGLGSLTAANYTFSFVPGTLTVTERSAEPAAASGIVFFDANRNGQRDSGEPGIGGIPVQLLRGSALQASTMTAGDGSYSFTPTPGAFIYEVDVTEPAGLNVTTLTPTTFSISDANVTIADIGLGLNLNAIRGVKANGYTIGYWKNNLEKWGKKGSQVSASKLDDYTKRIAVFALTPFDGITPQIAIATMSSNSSKPTDLLAKQLLASEYNYHNGAYLGGNETLTRLFLWWGEYVLRNANQYSSSYLIYAKDWFDAYNNSHGGPVVGPLP